MKTKEQIFAWLDKQPWKNEFYEEYCEQNPMTDDVYMINADSDVMCLPYRGERNFICDANLKNSSYGMDSKR